MNWKISAQTRQKQVGKWNFINKQRQHETSPTVKDDTKMQMESSLSLSISLVCSSWSWGGHLGTLCYYSGKGHWLVFHQSIY